MPRKSATIISDLARGLGSIDAGGDWHDVPRHHRYYGSSACNGGERSPNPAAARARTG